MQPNIMTPAMKSGLILGILFFLNFLLSSSTSVFLSLLSWVVLGAIIYMTYRYTVQFRDNDCGGYITYGRSFLFILMMYFFAALISALLKFFYLQFINPEYLTLIYDQVMEVMDNMNLPIDYTFEETISSLLKPAAFSLQFVWVNMLSAVFIGLIISAFTKKEKNIFDNDNTLN